MFSGDLNIAMESDSVADLCTVKVEDDPLCHVDIKTEPEVCILILK